MDSVTRNDEDSVQEFFVPRTRAARVEKDEDEGEGAEENESKVDDVERSHRVFLTKSQSGGFCFREGVIKGRKGRFRFPELLKGEKTYSSIGNPSCGNFEYHESV